MEPNEKEKQLEEDVITVELGKESEVKTVEQEIADETPTEAPEEGEVKEEPTEAHSDTDISISPSEEKQESEEVKNEVKSDDTPSEEKKEEEQKSDEEPKEEQGKELSEEPSDAPTDEDKVKEVDEEPSVDPNEELEKAQRELAEYKEAEEKRVMVSDIQNKAIKAVNDFDDFSDKLSRALEDTFKQYEIDTNKTLDELKATDPAKYSIACELIGHAEAIRNQKIREFQAPVIEAQKALVFREASKLMCKYDLTDEQAQETATTLVDIINQAGIVDIEEDLAAKVELAVARAKFIKPALVVEEKVKEEVSPEEAKKEEEVKSDANDTEEEKKADDIKEKTVNPVAEEIKAEPKVELTAFMDGASTGDIVSNAGNEVTAENVLQKLAELPYRDRGAFYKKYEALISQVGIQKYRQQGLK